MSDFFKPKTKTPKKKITKTVPEMAEPDKKKRGPKPKEERRKHYVEKYGERIVSIVEGEAGRKSADIAPADFERILANVRREKGLRP